MTTPKGVAASCGCRACLVAELFGAASLNENADPPLRKPEGFATEADAAEAGETAAAAGAGAAEGAAVAAPRASIARVQTWARGGREGPAVCTVLAAAVRCGAGVEAVAGLLLLLLLLPSCCCVAACTCG